MNWSHYIKRTAVRRVVWIVVGLLVYAVLGWFGDARAQSGRNIQQAYDHCISQTASSVENRRTGPNICAHEPHGQLFRCHIPWMDGTTERYLPCGTHNYLTGCPVGEWRDDLKRCAESCSSRGAMQGAHRWTGDGVNYVAPCIDGCEYDGGGMCAGSGNQQWCVGRDLEPTGAQCTVGPVASPISREPDGVCSPIGNRGAQHCVSRNNRHCIVHASGLSQCWDGNETGPRVNRSGTDGASREQQPTTPQPHPEQEGAQAEGSGSAHVGGQGGGSFNIIEFSGNGNSADASDNGSEPGEGSAPGWGNTIGPGDGDGAGEGEGEGPGKPGPGLPDDFYEGDERTLSDIYDEFRDRVSDAPVVNFADGFFTAPQGGSCPTFTLPASAYWSAMVFDYHCREPLSAILIMMGWLVLALAAYRAFHIAVG